MAKRGTLQDEIKQSRPFRSSSQEATLGILRSADILRHRLDSVLRPAGVTRQQYNVLRILRGAGPGGLPTLAIGERMVKRSPGITRLIDRLAARALVCRESVLGDRRRVQCRITDEGLELLASLDAPVDAADTDVLSMLDGDETRTLIELLDRIRVAHEP